MPAVSVHVQQNASTTNAGQPRTLISIIGYPYSGKDAVADILCKRRGFVRYALGDVLKRQLQPFLKQYGFDAFETEAAKKNHLRPVLEAWSEVNAQSILATYYATMPAGRVVNPRMVRIEEFERWTAAGGIVIEVIRPGTKPASPWEESNLNAIRASGGVSYTISNSSDLKSLEGLVLYWFDGLQSESDPDCASLVGYSQPQADQILGAIRRHEKKIEALRERLSQLTAGSFDKEQLKLW